MADSKRWKMLSKSETNFYKKKIKAGGLGLETDFVVMNEGEDTRL